ncbi:MAG: hypothetical protein ACXWL5_03365 [Candidatus Chromulinivorax sp.]
MKNYTKSMLLLLLATTCSSITFAQEENQIDALKSFDTVSLLEQMDSLEGDLNDSLFAINRALGMLAPYNNTTIPQYQNPDYLAAQTSVIKIAVSNSALTTAVTATGGTDTNVSAYNTAVATAISVTNIAVTALTGYVNHGSPSLDTCKADVNDAINSISGASRAFAFFVILPGATITSSYSAQEINNGLGVLLGSLTYMQNILNYTTI